MFQPANANVAPNEADVQDGKLDLEPTDAYLKRAKADIHRSKARAANRVALILVIGLILSLPLSVSAMASVSADSSGAHMERIFQRWFDIMSPLVGAVICALFGLSVSERGRQEKR